MITLLIFTVVFAVNLLTLRSLSVKNYSGEVIEVTGEIQEVNYHDDDNGVDIVVNGTKYNANRLAAYNGDLNLDELKNQTVTLYITKTQVGKISWVLGLMQGDQVLADYKQVIEQGRDENRNTMIVFGVCAGVCLAAACGVYVWRMRISPTKEYDLAQKYAEYNLARQPSCPEYRIFFMCLLIYTIVVIACMTTIGIVCDSVDNETIPVAIGVSLGGIALLCTIGMLIIIPLWIFKKEREFYVSNFPFDFSDVSKIPMRKKFKEQLQAELNTERELHPHRYGDGGNGYTVEFSETGLKIYDFDALYNDETPNTEEVFGVQDTERDERRLLCVMDYQTLNFEALPFYRKTNKPMAVVIKSRLNESDLPDALKPKSENENANDIHIIFDSNLLATLRHFNVPVENLDYILDNKEQLIAENCAGRKKTGSK
ncbi:MAG: hypothetical protein J1G02_04430 [Clostridiales bacterium]|nr:hypothetical protein [Clostridiales bacterium]